MTEPYRPEPYRIVGTPRFGGILVVSDHASNHIPADIDLGIAPELLGLHIAIDIGVAGVAERMAAHPGIAAFLATTSRLVVDTNRDEHNDDIIPLVSDGHPIPGNCLSADAREDRLARFYRPFHSGLARLLDEAPPALIVSLHSFTPRLASAPDEARPWQVGVLYNRYDAAACLAIPLLEREGLCVGDQEPYAGTELNATMDRHGEAEGRPYLALEVRQDQIADVAGQALWAERLARIANQVALGLG